MQRSIVMRLLYGLMVISLIVLNACGRNVLSATSAIESESDQQSTIPTLELKSGQQSSAWTSTPSSLELTKQAFTDGLGTREAVDQGTIQAGGQLPTPTGPVPSHVIEFQTQAALGYSPTPMPLPREGLEPDCGYTNLTYRYGNCWNINHNNLSYFMVAGSFTADTTQGVMKLGLDGPNVSLAELRPIYYLTPQKVGIIEVESAVWPNVIVRTQVEPRTTFTFNLETRQWTSINGTPVAPTPTTTPIPPTATGIPASGSVLFVANAITLNAADTAVKARLTARGYTVVVKAASAAQSSDATGTVLVVLSSTVISTQVNTKFRDVAVPVITWDMALYDLLRDPKRGAAAFYVGPPRFVTDICRQLEPDSCNQGQ